MNQFQKFFEVTRERGIRNALKSTKKYLLDTIFEYSFERKYGTGIYVMEKDWDNLILLDACRFDYFEKYINIEGKLEKKVSRGHESLGFIRENFAGKEHHDTVYITANPYSERLDQSAFYTVESLLDQWDPDIGTVLPEDVTEFAVQFEKDYPNKRLIIHYMQPHKPHLSQIAEKYNTSGWNGAAALPGEYTLGETAGESILSLCKNGHISRSELTQSYRETLKAVEPHVKDLVKRLSGKTVISADHGENLGERKFMYRLVGHHQHSKETRVVPWLELPFDERKRTAKDPPIGFEYLEEEYVQNRLQDLGYL